MKQEPKPGRRIVSRGEYAKRVGAKCLLMLWGIAACAFVFKCVIAMIAHWVNRPDGIPAVVGFVLLFVVLLMIIGCGFSVLLVKKVVKSIDTGVPLTRANAADLPAPDILVRASQEPAQAQEGILLRAAAGESQTGQEEQLLRASTGE